MADDFAFTPGTGATGAAQDIGGKLFPKIVGAVAHDGVAAGNPLLVGGYAKAAAPTDVSADGDAVQSWHLLNGAQCVQVTFGGTLADGNSGNKSAGTLRVVLATDQPALTNAQPANVSQLAGNGIAVGAGTINSGTQRVTVATDQGALTVASHAVTNAGTFAVQAACAGDTAAAATDAGNPVKVGGVAHTANPTAVTDGQRVNFTADKLGRQIVVCGQVRDLLADQTTTITSSTTETTVATAVASTFLDLVSVIIANTSATAVRVDFRDVTAGSVRFAVYCPAGQTTGFVPGRPVKQATVNTAWTAQCSASVADVRVFVQFEKNT